MATMAGQIPVGVRDVIGGEEIMRMSHIVMGVDLKTVSLKQRVSSALEERRAACKRHPT
jgi:hypothetical protein